MELPHSALSHVSLLFLQASDATQVASKSSPGVSPQQTNLSNIFASNLILDYWNQHIFGDGAIKKSVIRGKSIKYWNANCRSSSFFIRKIFLKYQTILEEILEKTIECRLQMFPISMFNILSLAARPKFKGYFISNYKGTHATFECNN